MVPDTILNLEIGDGRLAVTISPQGGPQCRISFLDGELSGPLYEVLATAAVVVGGAKLDGVVLFGREDPVLRSGGISQHDLPVLCELLETVRVPISRLGTEGRNGEQDNRCCGCFAGAYPDRSDPDKFVLVYATSTSVYGRGRRDECGCFASRMSLSNPCWAEAIEGISPLGARILDRTPPRTWCGIDGTGWEAACRRSRFDAGGRSPAERMSFGRDVGEAASDSTGTGGPKRHIGPRVRTCEVTRCNP